MRTPRRNPHIGFERLEPRNCAAAFAAGLPADAQILAADAFLYEMAERIRLVVTPVRECPSCGDAAPRGRAYCEECEAGLGAGD